MAVHGKVLAVASLAIVATASDDRNSYHYQCSCGSTFDTYNAPTLTAYQKQRVVALWGHPPASDYACVQGCACSCDSMGSRSKCCWHSEAPTPPPTCQGKLTEIMGLWQPIRTIVGTLEETLTWGTQKSSTFTSATTYSQALTTSLKESLSANVEFSHGGAKAGATGSVEVTSEVKNEWSNTHTQQAA